MTGLVVAGAAAHFDDRRNTSRVVKVPPGSHLEAVKAGRQLAESDPALYAWLLDGHPTLTEAEHVQRFGGPYEARKGRR